MKTEDRKPLFSYEHIDGREFSYGDGKRDSSWELTIYNDGTLIYEKYGKKQARVLYPRTIDRIKKIIRYYKPKLAKLPKAGFGGDDCDYAIVRSGDIKITIGEEVGYWFARRA